MEQSIKQLRETISAIEKAKEEAISRFNSSKDNYESQLGLLREQLENTRNAKDESVNRISELIQNSKNLEAELETCRHLKDGLEAKIETFEKASFGCNKEK